MTKESKSGLTDIVLCSTGIALGETACDGNGHGPNGNLPPVPGIDTSSVSIPSELEPCKAFDSYRPDFALRIGDLRFGNTFGIIGTDFTSISVEDQTQFRLGDESRDTFSQTQIQRDVEDVVTNGRGYDAGQTFHSNALYEQGDGQEALNMHLLDQECPRSDYPRRGQLERKHGPYQTADQIMIEKIVSNGLGFFDNTDAFLGAPDTQKALDEKLARMESETKGNHGPITLIWEEKYPGDRFVADDSYLITGPQYEEDTGESILGSVLGLSDLSFGPTLCTGFDDQEDLDWQDIARVFDFDVNGLRDCMETYYGMFHGIALSDIPRTTKTAIAPYENMGAIVPYKED